MNILKGDCLSIICKYLSPGDIINLLNVVGKEKIFKIKDCYLSVAEKFIDNWFRNFFDGLSQNTNENGTIKDYDNFRNNMIGSMISGSFILQLLLGEKWGDSDIDIFLKESHRNVCKVSSIHRFLYALQCKYNGQYICEENKIKRLRSYTSSSNEIHRILEYPIKNEKFQCIGLNAKNEISVLDHINSFDFNFCKNVFYYDDTGPHLVIPHLEDVIFKRTKISSINLTKSSLQRYEKYLQRGFTFY